MTSTKQNIVKEYTAAFVKSSFNMLINYYNIEIAFYLCCLFLEFYYYWNEKSSIK